MGFGNLCPGRLPCPALMKVGAGVGTWSCLSLMSYALLMSVGGLPLSNGDRGEVDEECVNRRRELLL